MSAQGLLLNAVPAFPAAATLATPSTLTLARHVAALRLTQQAVSRRALPLAPSAFPTCAALAAQRPLWGIAFGRPLVSAAASQQPSPVAPAAPPIIDRATPPLSAAGGKDADAAADDGTAKKPRARRPKKALMTVSENAVQRLKELFSQKNAPPAGIRLGVRTRGCCPLLALPLGAGRHLAEARPAHRCNGLSYTMNYVDEAPKLDEVVEATEGDRPSR